MLSPGMVIDKILGFLQTKPTRVLISVYQTRTSEMFDGLEHLPLTRKVFYNLVVFWFDVDVVRGMGNRKDHDIFCGFFYRFRLESDIQIKSFRFEGD